MVDNPTKIYNDYVRANLPNSMSYDTGTDRYDINSHSFFKFKNSNWYFNYISKYGYSALSAYAVNNFEPALVFDFKGNYFRKGSEDSTLAAATTYTGASNGTMTDSDGLLKWKPHNLLKYSEDITNVTNWNVQNSAATTATKITEDTTTDFHRFLATSVNRPVVSADINYTFSADIDPSQTRRYVNIVLQDSWATLDTDTGAITLLTSGTVTTYVSSSVETVNGLYRVSVTAYRASAGSLVVFVCGSDTATPATASPSYLGDGSTIIATNMHFYRSDLGGMTDNPATASSYVPTTSAAVYLPRTGNHVYNGSAWVNEGLLLESEARTNQMVHSGDLTNSDWTSPRLTVGAVTAGSPFGTYQSITPINHGTGSAANAYQIGKSITSGATYVGWSLVKYSAGAGWFALNLYDTSKSDERAYFDLQNGVVGSKEALIIDHGMIDYGDGWWLCWASSEAASGSGGMAVAVTNGDNVITSSTSDTILIAGTQLEQGATPSSYIPTTSAQVTRAAETLTVPAANMPWPTPVVTGSTIASGDAASDDTNSTGNWFKRITSGTDPQATTAVEITSQSAVKNTGTYALKFAFDGSASASGFVDLNDFSPVAGATYKLKFSAKVEGTPKIRISVDKSNAFSFNANVRILSASSTSGWTDYETVVVASSMRYFMVRSSQTSGASTTVYLDGMTLEPTDPIGVSIQMDGRMTGASSTFADWTESNSTAILMKSGASNFTFTQEGGGTIDTVTGGSYTSGVNVPFNLSSRHGSTFVNGAVDGVALTANTTPVQLPDLSATDFQIGSTFMGNIGKVRVWAVDLTDTGITEATLPSTEPSLSLTFDGSETSFIVLDWSE